MIFDIRHNFASYQGFLCPTCMKNFSTADALQQHFERDHAVGARPAADSGVSFKIYKSLLFQLSAYICKEILDG